MKRVKCCEAYWDSSKLESCPRCSKRLEGVTGPERQLVGESRSDEPQADVEEAKPGRRGVGEIADATELLRYIERKIGEARVISDSIPPWEKERFARVCGYEEALVELRETVIRMTAERSDLSNAEPSQAHP